MIRLCCPRRHLIAKVDFNNAGIMIPRGTRHGLSFDYAPTEDLTRIRATCPKSRCPYDASLDYGVLRDALAAAEAQRHADYVLTV